MSNSVVGLKRNWVYCTVNNASLSIQQFFTIVAADLASVNHTKLSEEQDDMSTKSKAYLVGGGGMLLIPWVTSRAARMNAGAVFISLLFWNWIWGVWGLLLGIPITVAFKTVCDHIESLNWVGAVLGRVDIVGSLCTPFSDCKTFF